ncbi:MAG TPA: GMC family oxidoreductase [Vicinamibacterales bacterium]|nr:GMC family oxidoreductase [Vicinamibacterales bacterium]
MLIDAARDPPRASIPCDVCIIGAGPAGITLARELDDGRREICLLESGGEAFEAATQKLLAAAQGSEGYPPLQAARVGALGGSTHVWAGWCRPLDAIDFERRPEIPSSGWPIARADLDAFYVQAHSALKLGPVDYDPVAWERSSGCHALRLAGDDIKAIVFRKSEVHFGRQHREALRRSQKVRVWLHSTALSLRYAPQGRCVQSIKVGVAGQRGVFDITPRLVVLAAGGIENARLLLLSDAAGRRGPVNAQGVVGRYFTEHCYVDGGTFEPSEGSSLAFCFPRTARGRTHVARGACALAPKAMRRHALLNCAIAFRHAWESDPAFDDRAVQSLLKAWDMCRRRAVPYRLGHELAHAARAPHKALRALWTRLRGQYGGRSEFRLRSLVECSADPENRVELGDGKDSFGRPLTRIRWRVRDLELRSTRDAHAIFAAAVRAAGLGTVTLAGDDWVTRMDPALHHLGTTRMHDDPAQGVVDRNARVHGFDNLYVAGGSVFTTGGFANPTLTILALTLRLAAHLKAE